MGSSARAIHFDADGLYVVLSDQGANQPMHWGLYLHTGKERGLIFHIRNRQDDPTWFFEHKTSERMMQSQSVMVALKIAVLQPAAMHDALEKFMGTTTETGISMEDPNRYGQLTCRTWVMLALYELDQHGYISIMPGYTIEDVEAEATGIAMENARLKTRIPDERLVVKSHYSKA
ncbi:hypothetical protein PWT90_06627 [Aphanocladium album]|nr:hypothetical protein PWT90_06627 [Aphanocladium album]